MPQECNGSPGHRGAHTTSDPVLRAQRQYLATTDYAVPAALAFVSGFVDVNCYLGLFQTFVAFMTGTLIVLGSEIADPNLGIVTKLLVVTTFLPAAAGWVIVVKHLRGVCRDVILHYLLMVEAALLAVVMVLGGLWGPLPGAGAWQTMVIACLAVVPMCLQNVMMVQLLGFHPATTVMTLNITHFVSHTLKVTPTPARKPEAGTPLTRPIQLKRFGAALGGFSTGVVAGAFGYDAFGFWSLGVTVAVLLALSLWVTRLCLICYME